ncbi:MAG: LysE family translocator [Sulfitobacter sp.]
MPPFDNIIAVLVAGFLLSATPGPSMLYVLSRSVGQSRSAGLASAFGLALGGMVLAVATAMGLAQVFAKLPQIVEFLKYVGSGYLVWLGGNMILGAHAGAQEDLSVRTVGRKSFRGIIWQGIVVEVLNPKTVLFFALFLPPFVDAGLGQHADIQTQLLVLGVLVPLTAIPSDIIIAYLGGTLAQNLNNHRKFRECFAWAGGLALIAIAVNLHTGVLFGGG